MTTSTMAPTMIALRAHARGGAEQLVVERAPVPVPGPGEALVEVHAAGITFAELTWDLSWTTRDGRDRTPVIPSHEVSGVVAGLGEAARGLTIGDEVYGLIAFDRNGAAAEYVAAPAGDLAARPRTVTHAEAASLPLAALTAWQALTDHAGVRPGDRVLIQGGAGGVGVYAVQLAVILGAQVTATGQEGQGDFITGLGAREFRRAGDPALGGFDVVIDTVGGPVLEGSYELVKRGGSLVTLSAPPSATRAEALGIRAMFFVVTADADQLARIAELTDSGELRPVLSQAIPLSEGRAAYQSAAQPRPPGKTVLLVR